MKDKLTKYAKRAGIGLAALFAVVTAVGYLLPAEVRVKRSIVVDAEPETIYPLIANLREGWPKWTPWSEEEYPNMQLAYSGPEEGVGATQTFQDNGEGWLTITKADPDTGIEYDLSLMDESFRLKGSLLCHPTKDEKKTEVVWMDDMQYANPYYRYFGLFIDEPLGEQLEAGLVQLKAEAERAAAQKLTAQRGGE